MKTKAAYIVGFLLLTLISCTKEINDPTDIIDNEDLDMMELEVLVKAKPFVHSDTRTIISIDDDLKITETWSEKDTIAIFPEAGEQVYFSMSESNRKNRAHFNGGKMSLKKASKYAAYYPYNPSNRLSNNKLDYTGQVQYGNGSTTHLAHYDFLGASLTSTTEGKVAFELEHIGALLQIKLTNPSSGTFTSLKISTKDNDITNVLSLDLSGVSFKTKSIEIADSLELELDNISFTQAGEELVAYIMVPPMDLSNDSLFITVFDDNDYSYRLMVKGFEILPSRVYSVSGNTENVILYDEQKTAELVENMFMFMKEYMPTSPGINKHNDFGYPSIMMFTDANGIDVVSDHNAYNFNKNNLDFSDRQLNSDESVILWQTLYKQIDFANKVVASVNTNTSDPLAKFYLAQGLSVRAFSYWVLAQLYQFNYKGNESKPCVPLITDLNSHLVKADASNRSTVNEVYTQIMNDLNKAILLLEIEHETKNYINKDVAYGLRARVNLTMQNWTDAASDASNAILNSKASPGFYFYPNKPSFWNANEENWMWGIIISETDEVVTSGIVNWISHMGSLNYGYANFSGGKQINKSLFESIPNSDARKGWWLDENLNSDHLNNEYKSWINSKNYSAFTQVKFGPYMDIIGTAMNANDIPLMRIEEMYLIKAEAEAMSVSNGLSTLVDFIRKHRDFDYSFSSSSPKEIQDEVHRQRRIELWGEGLSWFDIMRLRKPVDRRGAGFPNPNMVLNIAPDDPILLWPIPEL